MTEMRWDRTHDCSSILDEELLAFERYIAPSGAEVSLRWEVFRVLSDLLEKAFPEIVVMPYGSLQSELFLSTADIDVMIEYSASRTSELLLPAILSLLQQTGFILPRSGICILNTPVPFVRFTTLPKFGSSRMDITLNIDDGIAGTKKLEELFKEDWAFASHRRERARRLILFVKFFLQHHKHYGAPAKGLTGLAVSCMVIAYFKIETMQQLGELAAGHDLIDFLEFYGARLKTRQFAISTKGEVLLNYWKHWQQKDDPKRISIESPLRPKEDLTANCEKSSSILKKFDETAYSLESFDAGFASQRPFAKQDYSDRYYAQESILASVLEFRVSAEVQKERLTRMALEKTKSVSRVLDRGGVQVHPQVVGSVQELASPSPPVVMGYIGYALGVHLAALSL